MKIKVGDLDVFESGTVVGNDNEPIDFIINETSGFIYRMVFKNDANQIEPPHLRKAEKFGKNGLQLTFTNYNYPTGIGNTTPVKLGKFQKRELFLNYRIYSLENSGKIFHYTWLLGKEVQNG